MRQNYEVRRQDVMGKYRSRSAAVESLKMMIETTMKVNGSGTYTLTKTGTESRPFVITRTSYVQRKVVRSPWRVF